MHPSNFPKSFRYIRIPLPSKTEPIHTLYIQYLASSRLSWKFMISIVQSVRSILCNCSRRKVRCEEQIENCRQGCQQLNFANLKRIKKSFALHPIFSQVFLGAEAAPLPLMNKKNYFWWLSVRDVLSNSSCVLRVFRIAQ